MILTFPLVAPFGLKLRRLYDHWNQNQRRATNVRRGSYLWVGPNITPHVTMTRMLRWMAWRGVGLAALRRGGGGDTWSLWHVSGTCGGYDNLVWILKGFKPLRKNLDNSPKNYLWHDLYEYEFRWPHLYAKIWRYNTSGNWLDLINSKRIWILIQT
jgi:hypothetical protein